MKIRFQFVLVLVGISLMLFFAVLFSFFLLLTYTTYKNVKIEAATVQSATIRSRYYMLEMLVNTNPAPSIISDYERLEEQLTRNIAELGEGFFIRRSSAIRSEHRMIRESWEEIRELVRIEEISSILNARDEADGDIRSLLSMQARIQESGQEESELAKRLDKAIEKVVLYESAFIDFERLLQNALFTLDKAVNEYRITMLAYMIVIPVIILLISIGCSSLFAAYLSRKVNILNNSLNGVIRGDFSVRAEMKGDDEFTSLAGSINAFTKTLGDKLESFRLIMHDIGSTLETELETVQIESTQIESTLLNLAMREATANGAALYRVGSESNELVLSVAEGKFRPPFVVFELPESPPEEDIQALLKSQIILTGETMLGESATHGKPIMIRDVEAESGINWKRSENDPLYLASIIVVPLQVGSTIIGVLTVTSNISGNLFTDLEFANMQSFAELAAISLDNIYRYSDLLESAELERDIGIAEEIQRNLLPGKMPKLSGASVACLSRSMKGLNGDYFDVYPMSEGKVMLTICEIVGRGIPASLVMVMIRTLLRIAANPDADALAVMNKLNQDMTKQVFIENYASVGIFLVDSDGKFTYSSAAQNSAKILRSTTKEIEILHTEGIPIGIDKDAKFRQTVGELSDKDLVLFHSDGIPESRDKNGNEFGIEKLLNIVRGQSGNNPEQMVDVIRTELENFERDTQQKDDQTAIIFRFEDKKLAGNAA